MDALDAPTAVVAILATVAITLGSAVATFFATKRKSGSARRTRGAIGLTITGLLFIGALWVHLKVGADYPVWWETEESTDENAGWALVIDAFGVLWLTAAIFGTVYNLIFSEDK